jgi:hypothetical protein
MAESMKATMLEALPAPPNRRTWVDAAMARAIAMMFNAAPKNSPINSGMGVRSTPQIARTRDAVASGLEGRATSRGCGAAPQCSV